MGYKLVCSRCHGKKNRRKESLPQNKKTYICRSCRYSILATRYLKPIVTRTKTFRELRATILAEVKNFERSMVPASEKQATFIKNIENIMSRHFIRDYRFNVVDNKLVSIEIDNLPVLGSLSISIYEPKK